MHVAAVRAGDRPNDVKTQAEPAMLDARVRQALYTAIDKETWAVAMLSGNRDMVSHSLLPPDHSLYEFTKDSFRASSYDPQHAIRVSEPEMRGSI